MKALLIVAMGVAFIPATALAEPGGGNNARDNNITGFTELSYSMMRDGRLAQALAEQRMSKEAYGAYAQRYEQRFLQEPTATGSVRRLRR